MANSKGQNDINQDSDDFLSEFLSFVQQHKESSLEANRVSVLSECSNISMDYKTQSVTRNATIENSIFDLDIPCIEGTIPEEDITMLNPDKTRCLPNVSTNDAVIGILSDPVISNVGEMTPFLRQTKYSKSDTDPSISKDNRVDHVISKRVSAELEQVLSNQHAFEDIGLYLECSEDEIQSIQVDNAKKNKFGTGNFCLHAGNFSVQSDASFLKISFPTALNENDDTKRCSSCKVIFASAVELIKHMNSGVCKVLFCKECIYNTKSVKRFLTHIEKRHSAPRTNMFSHDYNSQSSCNNDNFINEVEISCSDETNTDTDESCVTSGQSANVSDSVEGKSAVGKTAVTFQCHSCDYAGSSAKLLRMHRHNLHNQNRGLYHCKACSYTCLQKRTLDAHSKTHAKEFLFHCPECKKSFATSSALTRHSKTHRINRDFVCSICGKAFKIKCTLTDHMKRVHMVDKSNSFNSFNSNDQNLSNENKLKLNNAISESQNIDVESDTGLSADRQPVIAVKVVTDDDNKTTLICAEEPDQMDYIAQNKRFSCSWPNCGKQFRDNYNLNSHFRRHTENKDLSCPECDFKCIQKGHLNHHIKTKHSKK